MDTAIIVAIIGASATVLVAVLQLRKESNQQHGDLMRRIKAVQITQSEMLEHIDDVREGLQDHLGSHDAPKTPAKRSPVSKAAPKKSK